MERRDFLKSALVSGAACNARGAAAPLPRRKYKDNVELSIIGFGGVVNMRLPQAEAGRMVALSVDRGVNYFDVAPSYGDGEAEQKLGPALAPYRAKVFLACKTGKRDAAGAQRELEQSLQRLRTDRFDLYQFHAVATPQDVAQILGPGGAAETFLKARQDGKVKYLGCSAHSVEAALAMLDQFPLDSILYPVNYISYAQAGFGPQILARAKEKGVARLALKALARTSWPKGMDPKDRPHPKCWYQPFDEPEAIRKALRFTLSEDITAAIPPGDEKLYLAALDAAASFQPLSPAERQQLLASAQGGVAPLFPVS